MARIFFLVTFLFYICINKKTKAIMNYNSQTKKRVLYNMTDGHCGYCGRKLKFEEMTIDHIKPQSKYRASGKKVNSSYSNLICSCKSCNSLKSNLTVVEFRKILELSQNFYKKNSKYKSVKFYFETNKLKSQSLAREKAYKEIGELTRKQKELKRIIEEKSEYNFSIFIKTFLSGFAL